jgi:hypothetical protein
MKKTGSKKSRDTVPLSQKQQPYINVFEETHKFKLWWISADQRDKYQRATHKPDILTLFYKSGFNM